jgi:hypothetical protein
MQPKVKCNDEKLFFTWSDMCFLDRYNGRYTVDEVLYYENIKKLYTDSEKRGREGRE